MRVAISGAQSTGKTTLLNALRDREELKQYAFIDEVTRSIKAKGFNINEQGTDETQIEIMKAHIQNLKQDDTILDRCSLDGVVYTHYLYNAGKVTKETLDYAIKVFEETVMKYDAIFFLSPEFDIVDDNVRSTNVEFRNNIVLLFDYYIQKYNLQVVQLTGSVEDRVNQFLEYAKLFNKRIDLHIHLGYIPKTITKKSSKDLYVSVDQCAEFISTNKITTAVILYEKYELLEQLQQKIPDVELIGLQYISKIEGTVLDIGKPLFRGIKLHNRRNLDRYTYENVECLISQLPANSIVLYHTQQRIDALRKTEDNIQQIVFLAIKYKNIKHIIGHAGAYGLGLFKPAKQSRDYDTFLRYWVLSLMIFAEAAEVGVLPNVLLETSAYNKEKLLRIRKFGIGTDFNFNKGGKYDAQWQMCANTSKIGKLIIQKQARDFLDLDITKIDYI